MRVVTFGFQTWGRKTLQALIDSRHEVVLSVTHPQSDEAYKAIFSDSVEELAREQGIPCHLAYRVDNELIDVVKHAEPDVIVVNSWYTWMPRELYDLPPHGTLNLHDSMLPKFTGFSPVLWALISGAPEVGLTVHRMNESLDAGDILVQRSRAIGPTDTGTGLVTETMELIGGVVTEALDLIDSGTAVWTPQDPAERTFFYKRSEADSLIDWTTPAVDLERFVRALSDPYPNAFTHYRRQRIRIIEAEVSVGRFGGKPGRVIPGQPGGAVVVTGEQAFRGNNHGLVVKRIRTDDGVEHIADEFFSAGGYLVDTAV